MVVAVAFTLGWHTRINEHSALFVSPLPLSPECRIQWRAGRGAADSQLLHDALPRAGGLFPRRAARGEEAGYPRRTAHHSLGLAVVSNADLLALFSIVCHQVPGGPLWLKGTVVHYILFLREFRVFDAEWLAGYPLVINALTHGACLIEFALAFWLWFRPTRRWAILGGVLLHAGIRPILNVPGFGEILVATYVTFLAPDELDALLRFLDPRRWLARLGLRLPVAPLWNSGARGAPHPWAVTNASCHSMAVVT